MTLTIRRWLAVGVGLGVLLTSAGLSAERVLAHAVLLRTIPSSTQTLARPPDEVRLLFSEPIDSVFSGVHVTDAALKVVDRGDARVDPDDDHQLVVSLQPELPTGVYLVTWRSLSTIDVHPDGGAYPLFVGVPVASVFVGLPAGAPGAAGANGVYLTRARPETTIGRWWFYLAASLFGGVMAAWKLVIGPLLADQPAASRAALHRRAHRVIVLGGVLLVVGTLFTALAQAAAAADVPLLQAFGQPLPDLLLRGRFATIWWPRIGLEVASLLLVAFAGLDGLAADCALAMLPGVLLTSSLTSHGAALPDIAGVGIVVDWLHIAGATAWVGGLVGLLIGVPVLWRHGGVSQLTARFSRFALAALAIVVLSGIVQAVFEVGSWSALVETAYGELVVAKIALLGAMLALAAFNTRQGRLVTSGDVKIGHLRVLPRGIGAELLLGVVVLAVAAVLTGTPPALR